MKIRFISQRREMLLFLTLTHHPYGHRDVTYKPAIPRLCKSLEIQAHAITKQWALAK